MSAALHSVAPGQAATFVHSLPPAASQSLSAGSWTFTPLPGQVPIAVQHLPSLIEGYLADCEMRLYSADTLTTRRVFLKNLLWFLEREKASRCGADEIRRFFHYLHHGHKEEGGRFGIARLNRPVRPVTLRDYYICFRTCFDWAVEQELIAQSPMEKIAKPQVHEETKPPLSAEHIQALFEAAAASTDPLRNQALLSFLLDTGCRASEVCALCLGDLDLLHQRCRVLGKGNKYRTVFFGERTRDALQTYLAQRPNLALRPDLALRSASATGNIFSENDSPLFLSRDGRSAMTRSGLLRLFKRLAAKVGIRHEVCVHALRRSFAVQMLRNGAHVFSVQALLGHTDLQQTQKYCALAMTDAEAQHRQFSPMDRLAPMYRLAAR